MTLKLAQAWLESLKSTNNTHQIHVPPQIINLQQQNTFVYSVNKPRREPFLPHCANGTHIRTTRSLADQAYIIDKAKELGRSFSFCDFPELGHDLFRKCILELKQRAKTIPLEPRTNPRFYILPEWLSLYPSMNENNTVKPKFAVNPTRKVILDNC